MPGASHLMAFLMVFTALFLFALVVTVASEFSDVKWVETIVRIGEGLGRLTFVSIAIAFILVEGVPMLAAWYKREMEIKAREEGRVEEREAWQDWLRNLEAWEQRKSETEGESRTFDEPRPVPPGSG